MVQRFPSALALALALAVRHVNRLPWVLAIAIFPFSLRRLFLRALPCQSRPLAAQAHAHSVGPEVRSCRIRGRGAEYRVG
jgi:hypothetical protein